MEYNCTDDLADKIRYLVECIMEKAISAQCERHTFTVDQAVALACAALRSMEIKEV